MALKKKKILRISLLAALLLVILLAIGRKSGCVGKKDITQVACENPAKRNIVETVSASGKIQPETEVKISPDVSGEVVELYVKEGDKVTKGMLLAKINPDIYISNFERMQASLNAQKANEANAKARVAQVKAQFINTKANFERNENLWKQGVISQSEYDAAKAAFEVAKEEVTAAEETYKAARYTVESTEAAVKEARENLTKTSIFSPVDGTISKLSVEKGERVVGTSQFAGTEIMRIANLSEMEVNVSVNENDIVRVKLGDTAIVEVDAYLNRKFRGVVTEIANTASVSGISAEQVTNFEVKIRILRSSYSDLIDEKHPERSPFRPGMSASVNIRTETRNNVLSVPIASVIAREDSAAAAKSGRKPGSEKKTETELKEYVFVYADGKVRMTEVKTGIQDNMYIEIISGITEAEEVVSAPYTAISKKLKNGTAVKKVKKEELFKETAEK